MDRATVGPETTGKNGKPVRARTADLRRVTVALSFEETLPELCRQTPVAKSKPVEPARSDMPFRK